MALDESERNRGSQLSRGGPELGSSSGSQTLASRDNEKDKDKDKVSPWHPAGSREASHSTPWLGCTPIRWNVNSR